MHCYFDIFLGEEIVLDLEGIEVTDLDDAIGQAQKAIEEMKEEGELPDSVKPGGLVIVRIRFDNLYCLISLD